jgi:hypothetical protein
VGSAPLVRYPMPSSMNVCVNLNALRRFIHGGATFCARIARNG